VRRSALALSALVGLALVPELSRYRAERELYAATAELKGRLAAGSEVPSDLLDQIAAVGVAAAERVPGDPRGVVLAGAARLVGRRPEEALELYRRALATGERAEILLNMGRAHMMLRDLPRAQSAFIRAGWVSPALLAALPPEAATPLAVEIRRLEGELAAGRLAAPPLAPK
jgi:tetratricopeptide (TPR) repeat protein